jgi:hypothetical protein
MIDTNDFKPGMNADIVASELAHEEAGRRLAERRRGRPPKDPGQMPVKETGGADQTPVKKEGPRISGKITGTIDQISYVFNSLGLVDKVITVELEEEECTRT